MEWSCPICGSENKSEFICSFCKYDHSTNYESFLTLAPISNIRSIVWQRKNYQQNRASKNKTLNRSAKGLYYKAKKAKDNTEKHDLLYQAALLGLAEAQRDLGLWYYNSDEHDYVQAVEWFWKSADQLDADAQYCLGLCYRHGNGVIKNDTQAFRWFLSAAKQRQINAQYIVAKCYFTGRGVNKDEAKGVTWLIRAAAGRPQAMLDLGDCYVMGKGVDQNAAEGLKWYRKAAENGHPEGLTFLGKCYKSGEHVRQNKQQALDILNEAARYGSSEAKSILASMWKM